ITHEDALLLLGLKNEVNFKNKTPQLPAASLHQPAYSPSTAVRPPEDWTMQESVLSRLHENPERAVAGRAYGVPSDLLTQQNTSVANVQKGRRQSVVIQATQDAFDQKMDAVNKEPTETEFAIGTQQQPSEQLVEPAPSEPAPPKKQRRIKPEVQAEVC